MPEVQCTFQWFVCYEALLQRASDLPTESLQWTHRHIPISVSICSNVEGHIQPVCIVDQLQDRLVQLMVLALDVIACRVIQLAKEKWGWVLEAIDKKLIKKRKARERLVKTSSKKIVKTSWIKRRRKSQRNNTVIH